MLPRRQPPAPIDEESGLSRFDPVIKSVLEEHIRCTLDQNIFPFTKPHLDAAEGLMGQENISQASLRSAKPTWARIRSSAAEPRQRIIVFMAGGATYSESRACYEVSESFSKDIFLTTSHMLTPSLFLRQVGDLSVDKRRLNLPAEQPKPRAPAHLFESDSPPSQQHPTARMAELSLNANTASVDHHTNGIGRNTSGQSTPPPSTSKPARKDREKDVEKKKKHHFFGSKK